MKNFNITNRSFEKLGKRIAVIALTTSMVVTLCKTVGELEAAESEIVKNDEFYIKDGKSKRNNDNQKMEFYLEEEKVKTKKKKNKKRI